MSGYTKNEIIAKVNKAKVGIQSLYKQDFVNYKGSTSDSDEAYSEIIAENLMQNTVWKSQIKKIKRDKSYKTDNHNGQSYNNISNRKEEKIAMGLYLSEKDYYIGKIIDYQTPLKGVKSDKAGKIDLLSFDSTKGILRIIELKKDGSKETLLRSILEAYTYYETVDIDQLANDFKISEDYKSSIASIMFFKDSQQYKEYEEMKNGKRDNIKALINELKVELLLISDNTTKSNDTSQPNDTSYVIKILPII